MHFTDWRKKSLIFSLILLGLICLSLLAGSSATLAQSNAAFIMRVRALKADETGLANPAGLAFTPGANAFYAVEARGPGQPPPAETDILKLTPFGDRAGSARIAAAIEDPLNMTFDSQFNRLLIFQSPNNMLIEVLADPDGNLDPTTLIRHDARHFNLQNPQGLTVDPDSETLFILDAAEPEIVRVEPESDGSFDNAVIAVVDLTSTDLVDPRGLAFDPTTGHLHVVNPTEQVLYELTQTGQVVTTRNLSEFQFGHPHGMVFAPSGDLTDDPLEMSLYLVDRGLGAGGQGRGARSSRGGRLDAQSNLQSSGEIVELSFVEPAAAVVSTFQAFLVQTIDTSQWSPSSPDPSGIVYLPAYDNLLVSDGEVNEMPIFTGDNLFQATLTGDLTDTLTTISFSDEPTGVTLNPTDGHLFFSDDTGTPRVIYEMNPGDDGLYDTSDDIITSFSTSDFGSADPEGVTYDRWQGVLFIADGVNKEVYRVSPGANGTFDGIAPAGDDQVTSFDTERLGMFDLEGIAFNADSGTLYAGRLYLVGEPADTLFEVTPTGDLVQTIDISAAGARKPAGLAYAPGSQDPAVMNIYIVERGVDNNSDPNENDGKIYELTLPPLITTPVPPLAEDDSASTPEDTAVTIDVAANDCDLNGNLDPASTTTTCPTCSVPANGTLLNNGDGTFDYTPNPDFNGSDSFVYEICDTDTLCDTATVSLTVDAVNDPPVAHADSANTPEDDTPVTIDVAANDTDPDGNLDPASANTACPICSVPANGTLLNNGDGTFDYTPAPDFSGLDSFVYEICDTGLLCDTATVGLTVDAVNDPPVAHADSASTPEDTVVTIDVAANDTDADGNLNPASTTTTCPTCSEPANGTLLNNGDGTFDYTPAPDFNGLDSFVYEICDTGLLCDTATVSLTVDAVNDPPVAHADSASTPEDTAVTINVAANDTDPDGNLDPASADTACLTCAEPANGTLLNNGDGTFDYTPAPDFNGSDSFVYEICDTDTLCDIATASLTVDAVNDPPVAHADSASTPEDTAVTIDVAATDTDPDGNLDPASANNTCVTCSVPANGTLLNNGDGTFDYTPAPDFSGSDSFVYEICDTGLLCDTATVSITVEEVTIIFLPTVFSSDNPN